MSQIKEKIESIATLIVNKVQAFCKDSRTIDKYRTDEKHFSRDGKLPFDTTVHLLLSNMQYSAQVEIYKRMKINDLEHVMLSSFCKNRYKIEADLFEDLYKIGVQIIEDNGQEVLKKWHGFRLRAIDGTAIQLPDTPNIRKAFGVHKNGSKTGVITETPMARLLLEEDVLNKTFTRAECFPTTKSELSATYDWLLTPTSTGDLTLFDRNFDSFMCMYLLTESKKHFVIRMKLVTNVVKVFVASGERDKIVTFTANEELIYEGMVVPKGTTVRVRLVRVELSSGEIEVLATSLLDTIAFPTELFGPLYNLRWGVETAIDVIKNKFAIMRFLAHKAQGVYQEVYATFFNYNLHQIIVSASQEIVNERVTEKKTEKPPKHNKKVNNSVTIGIFTFELLGLWRTTKVHETVNRLVILFAQYSVPIRPNRTYPRKKSLAKRRNLVTTTNYRQTG